MYYLIWKNNIIKNDIDVVNTLPFLFRNRAALQKTNIELSQKIFKDLIKLSSDFSYNYADLIELLLDDVCINWRSKRRNLQTLEGNPFVC